MTDSQKIVYRFLDKTVEVDLEQEGCEFAKKHSNRIIVYLKLCELSERVGHDESGRKVKHYDQCPPMGYITNFKKCSLRAEALKNKSVL